jgi:long-chain fatty acid transport protein
MKSHIKPKWNFFCRHILAVLVLIISAAWPAKVFALGFLVPNQDAAAIARGNAFVATADDPAAIYYNPAGISQIPGQEFQLGDLNYMGIDAGYVSPGGAHSDTKLEDVSVPQIFYTYAPGKLPLTFGLGIYSPFGLGVKWPDNSGLRSLAIDSRLLFFTLNPVISWQATKTLSIAVGPTFNYARIKFNRGLASANDYFEFIGDDYAYGLTAGVLWQPVPKWSFGASYRLATTMDFSGTSTYYPGAGSTVYSAGTTASVPFPQTVSAGISFRPTRKWNMEFDVDYINWNTLGTVTLDGTKNIFGFNLPLQLNWHDSWQYKVGVTRYFDDGWFVSAGYFYSTDTTSSSDFTPAVPDTNLHVGSIGFGCNGEHWHWALAGQIIAGPSRTINATAGNTDPYTGVSAAGKYQLFVPTATLSVGYSF